MQSPASVRKGGLPTAQSEAEPEPAEEAGPHKISAQAVGKRNLTQMVVVPYATFVKHGSIPRRSFKTDPSEVAHVPVATLGDNAKVIFFSQRWLTPAGDPASPDDADLTKYKSVLASAKGYMEQNSVQEEDLYIWIDYSCIEQDDIDELIRGVNSLALYVISSDAFVTIEHEDYFGRGWCLMECTFADASKVKRYLMSTTGKLGAMTAEHRLGLKAPRLGNFTVESDRNVMQLLELLAKMITSRLERGELAGDWD